MRDKPPDEEAGPPEGEEAEMAGMATIKRPGRWFKERIMGRKAEAGLQKLEKTQVPTKKTAVVSDHEIHNFLDNLLEKPAPDEGAAPKDEPKKKG